MDFEGNPFEQSSREEPVTLEGHGMASNDEILFPDTVQVG